MKPIRFVIGNPQGIHLKPASMIAQKAQSFSSKIVLSKGRMKVDAKSVIDIVTLQAKHGSEIELRVNGKDEKQAMEALKKVIEKELAAII